MYQLGRLNQAACKGLNPTNSPFLPHDAPFFEKIAPFVVYGPIKARSASKWIKNWADAINCRRSEVVNLCREAALLVAVSLRDSEKRRQSRRVSLGETDLRKTGASSLQ